MASDTAPAFPQELINVIIAAVDDTRALKACSLVSRGFCAPAQALLFEYFELLPSSRSWQDDCLALASLDALLATSPHISDHVRNLTIDAGGPNEGIPAWITADELARVLLRFQNLVTVTLDSELQGARPAESALDWSTLPEPARAALARTLAQTTVTAVALRGLCFSSLLELHALLCPPASGRPQLREMSLCNVNCSQALLNGHQEESLNKLQLERLLLSTDDDEFVESLQSLVQVPCLQRMQLVLRDKDCEEVMQSVFLLHTHALRQLNITLEHQETETCNLALGHLKKLETLEIQLELITDFRVVDYHPGEWVATLLSSLVHSKCALARLTLQIFVGPEHVQHPLEPNSLVSTLQPLVPLFHAWVAAQFTPLLTIRVASYNISEISTAKGAVLEVIGELGLETKVELVQC
ncbi:hypothetical protein MIND_01208400 [Mycena indigotica]|uniref:Uncharacterized protein n=1 Tax=Mycena indigotica TaxID=2126181 RepID=A0A8H6S4P9_9AGAR|nr:uncharacterized protein MIND_01208400 [Mycena indigotica]KAF7293090.1 hypothetical protein MIND_01208400 [Mycena indigotica]